MRVTTKGARAFFLLMLTVLAILGIYQCFTMANAFNLSPYTFKLRAKGVATDSVSIYGGSLHAEHVDSVIVVTLRAGDKVVTDTIQGAASVVGIVDDTLRLDTDSTGAYAIITFGGWGGGIRWNQSTDAMEFTNDFATWTTFGSGSGTGDIEGVTAGSGLSGGGTSGTVTLDVRAGWGITIDNDSVKVNSAQVTGVDVDSTFVAHYSSRWRPLGDSAAQYIGDTGDSTVFRFIGASTTSNADDTVISFCKIYYGESVVDSALVTYGTLEAAVAALGSGDITGVITSGDWLEGGASSGDVALNIKAIYEDAYQVIEDTTAIEGTAIKLRQPAGNSAITMVDDGITIQNANAGSIILNVDGTPTNTNEMTISENNIEIRSAGSNGVLYLSGYDLERVAHVAVGSIFTSGGTSSAPTWQSIKTVIDSLTGTAIPLADSATGAARATTTKGVDANGLTEAALKAVNTAVDEDILTYESTTGDFEWHTPTELGLLTSETGDISNVGVTAPITGGGSSGSVTVGFDWAWLYGFIDTSRARIPASDTAYVVLHSFLYNYLDTSRARIPAADTAYVLLHSFAYNYIDTSSATIPRATLADSTNGGAIRAETVDTSNQHIAVKTDITDSITSFLGQAKTISGNWVNTANPWADNEVADNITVTGMGDLTDITAGNGLTGTSLTGPSPTINVVAGANGLTVNADSIYIDTTKVLRTKNIIANWITPWPDSVQGIGSGGGLTIGSSITLGTEITDDTLVVDYYPEYDGAVLADLIIPTWKDSIKIYGYIDTVAGMGNTMLFNDSVLTSGRHRRGVSLTINHPMRVDSLRYIIVQGLVKDSSATNLMWLKGMLRTSNFRAANVDSNTASTVKDYDSLGGDYGDVASVRQFVLSGGAVTVGTPWHLLLIARHGSGTAWNWAQVGRIRAVYSRTRL